MRAFGTGLVGLHAVSAAVRAASIEPSPPNAEVRNHDTIAPSLNGLAPPRSESPVMRAAEVSLQLGRTLARRTVNDKAVVCLDRELLKLRSELVGSEGASSRFDRLTDSLQLQGSRDVVAADRAAVEIGAVLRVPIVDARRIIAELRSLPPDMLQLVNECFEERHGRSIQKAVSLHIPSRGGWFRTLGQPELQKRAVFEYASGNPLEGQAAELALAFARKSVFEIADLFLRLREKSPDMLRTFCANYSERIAGKQLLTPDGNVFRAFDRLAENYFSGDRLLFVKYLAGGKLDHAYAALLHLELTQRGLYSRTFRSAALITQAPPETHPYIAEAYRVNYGDCPIRRLESMRPKGEPDSLTDISVFALEGDSIGYRAARVRAAIQGRTSEWIGAPFFGEHVSENILVTNKYEEVYKSSFKLDLEDSAEDDTELELLNHLIDFGSWDAPDIITASVKGFGAYAKGLLDALTGLSKGQVGRIGSYLTEMAGGKFAEPLISRPLTVVRKIADGLVKWWQGERELKGVFARKNLEVQNLTELIGAELEGDAYVHALRLMQGSLPTPASVMSGLHTRYRHERSRRLHGLVNYLNADAGAVDRDYRACCAYYDKHVQKLGADSLSNPPERWTQHHLRHFAALSQMVENSFDSVRDTRQVTANFVATQAASVVGMVTFLGITSYLGASFIAGVPGAAGTSILARALVKWLFSGRGYGRLELMQDSLFSAASGIGRTSKQVMGALRLTKSMAGGLPGQVAGYFFSWAVNKAADVKSFFGVNIKPKYLIHQERLSSDAEQEPFSLERHTREVWGKANALLP